MSKNSSEAQEYTGYEILVEIGEYPDFDPETLSQQFQGSLQDYFALHGLSDFAQIVNVPTKEIQTGVRFAGEEQNETSVIKIESTETDKSTGTDGFSDLVNAEHWFKSIINAIEKVIGSLHLYFELHIKKSDEQKQHKTSNSMTIYLACGLKTEKKNADK
jgi:hypothetical protein